MPSSRRQAPAPASQRVLRWRKFETRRRWRWWGAWLGRILGRSVE